MSPGLSAHKETVMLVTAIVLILMGWSLFCGLNIIARHFTGGEWRTSKLLYAAIAIAVPIIIWSRGQL
jgi:hypothetical protein